LGHTRGIANVLHSLGIVASRQGNYAAARTLYAQSLTIYRELGHKRGIANVLHSLGMIASSEGDYAAACKLNEQSLAIHRELGNRRGIANMLEAIAALAAAQGRPERAARLWGAVDAIRNEVGASLPSSERARFALLVERARAELSEDVFAAARAKGRAMTLDQAIMLALNDADS
jgi:tetratricopeptide (TPR) repeat protein